VKGGAIGGGTSRDGRLRGGVLEDFSLMVVGHVDLAIPWTTGLL
jgi:hypothetical protein